VFRNVLNSAIPLSGQDPIEDVPFRAFLAFSANFIGGSVVEVADMGTFSGGATIDDASLDGRAEIIVANGPGKRPRVKVFDASADPPRLVRKFRPLDRTFVGGLSIDLARVNPDAIPDLIVGGGAGDLARVEVRDGRTGVLLSGFEAYSDPVPPLRVAAQDQDGDGLIDAVLTAQGTDGQTREIRCFDPLTGQLVDTLFETDPDFFGAYFLDVIEGVDL
jgi:hypothetical protein